LRVPWNMDVSFSLCLFASSVWAGPTGRLSRRDRTGPTARSGYDRPPFRLACPLGPVPSQVPEPLPAP